MEEYKDRVQEEEQPVIQEQIMPKKKKSWKRIGKQFLRFFLVAVVFGLVAGVTFVITANFLLGKLGIEKNVRQIVGIGTVTPAALATGGPVPTKSPNATEILPDDSEAPENIGNADGYQGLEGITIDEETMVELLNMYIGITDLSEKAGKSLVKITAVSEGVDWFGEPYESSRNVTGLYVGNNGYDMLFLTGFDGIEGATKFQVTFTNGVTVPCEVFSYDTNYCLAVLAVRLSAVASFDEEDFPEMAGFAVESMEPGTPVIVLGNPNGHPGTMEIGITTGTDLVVQVIDDEVVYFTTGIIEYGEGDGFVFNLAGEVVGMLSSTLNNGEKGILTAVEVGKMSDVINATLNNFPRMYCGMRLESVDTVMGGKYQLPDGIYVSEVLPGSPAMYAGLKNGDIITKVGITPINDVRQFYEEISGAGPNSVRIIVNRDVKGERKEQTLYMTPELRYH